MLKLSSQLFPRLLFQMDIAREMVLLQARDLPSPEPRAPSNVYSFGWIPSLASMLGAQSVWECRPCDLDCSSGDAVHALLPGI